MLLHLIYLREVALGQGPLSLQYVQVQTILYSIELLTLPLPFRNFVYPNIHVLNLGNHLPCRYSI